MQVSGRKPLSYAVITEDHFGMVDGHQHTYENYHWVPSHGEWVHYYTGRMPHAGTLIRMKHHVSVSLHILASPSLSLSLSACLLLFADPCVCVCMPLRHNRYT